MGLNFGQNLFPARGEIIQSYDYYDIAEGRGYEIFYPTKGASGATMVVNSSSIRAENPHTSRYITLSNAFAKEIDENFDITFNNPKNVKGHIFVNVPYGTYNPSPTGGNIDVAGQLKSRAIHYDGTTETEIASSATFMAELDVGEEGFSYDLGLMNLDVNTLQHFKKGETLRINIQGYFMSDNKDNSNIGIMHDPSDSEDRTLEYEWGSKDYKVGTIGTPTRAEIHVPFKLDI